MSQKTMEDFLATPKYLEGELKTWPATERYLVWSLVRNARISVEEVMGIVRAAVRDAVATDESEVRK